MEHNEGDNEQSGGESTSNRQPRPRSIRSWRSRSSTGRSRTRSRPRSPESHLHQIYSAGFHDDHSTYVDQDHIHRTRSEAASPVNDTESQATSPTEKPEEEEKGQEEVESQYEEPIGEDAGEDAGEDRGGEHADLEKRRTISRQPTNKSTRSQRDPNMVSWNGPDDPENPKNWPLKRKWIATFVVSSFTFISPVASAMVAPALPQIAHDLGIHNQVESQMTLSIFLLAYAFGPLLLGPLSELYGRVPVLQLANLVFLVFNLVCGFAQTGPQMLVFRFLAGLGGSAPLAIGGGILADCFHPEQRGKAIAIYSLAPLLGPAVVSIRMKP